MDPSEKSNMGHAPPPPYNQGYPQPGPGYPQPGQGYGGPQYPDGQSPYQGQPATVTVQPTVFVTRGPLEHPANDCLCYSIFTMLCCCLPIGIAALVYSILTRKANNAGDQMGAERSSRMSKILNHTALGIGIGVITVAIVLTFTQR